MALQHALHRLGTVGRIEPFHRFLQFSGIVLRVQIGHQNVVHLLIGVSGCYLRHVAASRHAVAVGGCNAVAGSQGLVGSTLGIGEHLGVEILAQLIDLMFPQTAYRVVVGHVAMNGPEAQVVLRQIVGVHHQSARHRGHVVEIGHAQAGLDVALRYVGRGIVLFARGLHEQILLLQILHPVFIAESLHSQTGRVVLLGAVCRARQAHADEAEALVGIPVHHLMTDGSRHRRVQSAR